MIEIKDATNGDLDYCKTNSIDGDIKVYPNWDLTGWNKTVVVDGEIIGCGGVLIFWTGFGEAWICLSKNVERHKIVAVRFLKKVLEDVLNEFNLVRLQITVRPDFPDAIKLVESLGFQYEGIMRKYLPTGKDAYLYAIVR